MNENGGRNSTILLTVIGIATLLVVVTGATFAYFAAVIRGNENASSISITAATTGQTITMSGGEEITLQNIYPRGVTSGSEWATKNITLSSNAIDGNTGQSKYTFYATPTSTSTFDFTESPGVERKDSENIKITFTYVTDGSNALTHTEQATATKITSGATIASGTVSNSTASTVKYELKVYYDNAEYNQNNGEERTYSFYIGYTWADINA